MPLTKPEATDVRPIVDPAELETITDLYDRVQWLSSWTIHHANNIRESRDGLKVGGHQASSASLAAIMCALYFGVLQPEDRVAVKPHASPVFHAIQYLFGKQTRDQLERFRALGGAQSYPSRTKDIDDVDFSTGSVGLGVAMTAFASMVQDHLIDRGLVSADKAGRMIALMGDAELDEGNIYEALIEGYKHNLRNCWWVIDYNRQSLDSITSDRMFTRFTDIFETTGWKVINIKYGKKQQAAFKRPGGIALRDWIDACPNTLYSALTYKGGAAWRDRLMADIGSKRGVKKLLDGYSDDALQTLMTNLGGHDIELLLETFRSIDSDQPHCFICYTVKGYGLPFQGHKDNHSGLMNPSQMAELQAQMGVPEGREWEPFAGMEDKAAHLENFLKKVPFNQPATRRHDAPTLKLEDALEPVTGKQSTQVAFGKIMNALGKGTSPLADRIITTSPDVTVSTNLGGWVNQRGIYSRDLMEDVFKAEKVVSPQIWQGHGKGQHMELGIAENNLFLALAAMGLSGSLFGERLIPVGTLYDPFINRGLDALNYACYQDARFMLVATPSGLTLAPEGGAHQSIHTPVIGMAQDKLVYFEPAYTDELAAIMAWGFDYMQQPDGSSIYLRLSTRALAQPERDGDAWQADLLKGAYWEHTPEEGAELAIIYTGAVAPEANAALQEILEDVPGAGLMAVPSPDLLHKDWSESVRSLGRDGVRRESHIGRLLSGLSPNAGIVTVIDGAPTTLSWIGGVKGHRTMPLGVDEFGQSGDIDDLYDRYRIGTDAILDACASVFTAR
ncbi:transketolase [Kordiimonas lacus]|uniref:Pyruvate dehydrogenase E1 component n=1 Tax=Kordiimonas lacus TaxID=637679 RepID=A0A1G6XX24_9PROT|nr:transketolase [Kordiimonas lacus]SDD81977.1 pyruvate dehydrogenase E1 component [Kordiimonas lacus]